MFARRRVATLFALTLMLAGCGAPQTGTTATGSNVLEAMGRRIIGGLAYANFKLDPKLPTSSETRKAVKVTYLMTDDTAHQSPWSKRMLQMMDDLPQKNVHNLVFRDGGELGDSRLYYVQQGDTHADSVKAPESVLAPGVSEVQSNNPQVFSQVLGWTFDHYQGRRHYLQLYTHGAGVFGVGCDEKQTDLKGSLLPRDQSIWAMPMPDFAEALRQSLKGRQLDLIYFRACLMGNLEALYELRGTTRYVLASEDVSSSVDNSNLTMTKMFDDLANQDADPAEIARQLCIQAHAKHPDQNGDYMGYATMAACDLSRVDELKSAVNTLSRALLAAMPQHQAEIVAAYDGTPCYNGDPTASQYYLHMRDLWAFTGQLQQKVTDRGVLDAVRSVRSAQDAFVIHERDTYGGASNGLSILMPDRGTTETFVTKFVAGDYKKLRFAQDTAWDQFLAAMLATK